MSEPTKTERKQTAFFSGWEKGEKPEYRGGKIAVSQSVIYAYDCTTTLLQKGAQPLPAKLYRQRENSVSWKNQCDFQYINPDLGA